MSFWHDDKIWQNFSSLVPVVLIVEGITGEADTSEALAHFEQRAAARLASASPGGLPEIQAWRRVFSQMGLKPTQYRCASASLLRRYVKEKSLPRIHPLVDLCNAISLAYAMPVAGFDLSAVSGDMQVRYARGDERYVTFAGDVEQPEPGEVVFADSAGYAHARRWSNRQSGRSAVGSATNRVLIVAEGLHPSARVDMAGLADDLVDHLARLWSITPATTTLSRAQPVCEW